ncbi:hypothetical protein D3C71_2093920 [compost metagenome]
MQLAGFKQCAGVKGGQHNLIFHAKSTDALQYLFLQRRVSDTIRFQLHIQHALSFGGPQYIIQPWHWFPFKRR